jgi:hypothetical protein
MSAFEGRVDTDSLSTGKLQSISGQIPSHVGNNITKGGRDSFRTYAQNRGTGWQIQTYYGTHALQVLYLVEYADFDIQTTIGRGVTNSVSNVETGKTIFLGNESGREAGTDGATSISYRGIENLFGNVEKWLDGINQDGSKNVYAANEDFEDDKFTGNFILLGTTVSTSGFPNNILFPQFLGTSLGGSSSSHLHDQIFVASGNRVPRYGGAVGAGLSAGAFRWSFTVFNLDLTNQSARLQIL